MPSPINSESYEEEVLSEYLVRVHMKKDLPPGEKFRILELLDESHFQTLLENLADSLLLVVSTDGTLRCTVES